MIQEGLRVAVPLKDKTLGVVAVEVQLVLQSSGVFSAHQFRAFRGETLKPDFDTNKYILMKLVGLI